MGSVIDRIVPQRYWAWAAITLMAVACLAAAAWSPLWLWPGVAFAFLALVGLLDYAQPSQAIRRNYPVIAHFRFFFEYIRPEIRQYFIEADSDHTPFSRAQRSIIYQRAKGAVDKRPFGTQLDFYEPHYEWINHSIAPVEIADHDFRIAIGAGRVAKPYSASVFNISAMSFGALSANAILALNEGARRGRFYHDTGEGSISRYHREKGGDLVWEIGSGYFGCRDGEGRFNEERFVANATSDQVKMIEVKLSQGAKPGHGGVLPGAKVTPEIAEARHVPVGVDCVSPAKHSAFATPIELLQFIDEAAHAVRRQADGLQARHRPPVGMVRDREGDAGDRHHAGLRRGRRRRGRNGRGPAGIHRPRRRAAARGADARAQLAGGREPAQPRARGRERQGGHRLRHRAHHGHRRRLVQFGARLHVRARLPAGADLPLRPLSHGCDHPGSAAHAGAGRAGQGRARRSISTRTR